jgi:3-phenylpropionate/trans-cinnamate dioxygenase ferredoxin subunit
LWRSQREIPEGSLGGQTIILLIARIYERGCSMSKFTEVAKIEELKSGTMKTVIAGGHEILLARVGDKYYATDNRCPHMKGDLSQGKLEGTVVTCPVHGSQLDISNGQVVRWLKGGLMSKLGSALKMSRTLTVYNVKVEDGKVLVEF